MSEHKAEAETADAVMADGKTADAETAYTALKREARFVPVMEGAARYYGGDQAWFGTPVRRYSACGTVAAANIAAYQGLFEKSSYSREEYRRHMEEVCRFVSPLRIPFVREDAAPFHGFGWSFGVWPAGRFIRGMVRYARSRGRNWRPVLYRRRREAAGVFIERALKADVPVALLIGNAAGLRDIRVEYPDGTSYLQKTFSRHWVVITAMKREAGRTWIKVSTWGGVAWLPLEACFHTAFLSSRMCCFWPR